jgi:hypothetical protein
MSGRRCRCPSAPFAKTRLTAMRPPIRRRLLKADPTRVLWGADRPRPNRRADPPDDAVPANLPGDIAPLRRYRNRRSWTAPSGFTGSQRVGDGQAPRQNRADHRGGRRRHGWGAERAACVRFAEEGARICAANPRADPMEQTLSHTPTIGDKIGPHLHDVTDRA